MALFWLSDEAWMAMALFWLSDEAWMAIEPHLPKNQPGARLVDDRRVISGILHVLKVGCRWCDCPTDYGPSTTVYNRFNRWSHRGFWLKLLDALVDAGAVPSQTNADRSARPARHCSSSRAGSLRCWRPRSSRSIRMGH
jgi:transposase